MTLSAPRYYTALHGDLHLTFTLSSTFDDDGDDDADVENNITSSSSPFVVATRHRVSDGRPLLVELATYGRTAGSGNGGSGNTSSTTTSTANSRVLSTVSLPPDATHGELTFGCGIVDHAGLIHFRLVDPAAATDDDNGMPQAALVETPPTEVRWPRVRLGLPAAHRTLAGNVTLTVNSDDDDVDGNENVIRCESVRVDVVYALELIHFTLPPPRPMTVMMMSSSSSSSSSSPSELASNRSSASNNSKVIDFETNPSNSDDDDIAFATASIDETSGRVVFVQKVHSLSRLLSSNTAVTLPCSALDEPGVYQVVLRSSAADVDDDDAAGILAVSGRMYAVWSSDRYDLVASPAVAGGGNETDAVSAIFPCRGQFTLSVVRPRGLLCPNGDYDKIQLYRIVSGHSSSATKKLLRDLDDDDDDDDDGYDDILRNDNAANTLDDVLQRRRRRRRRKSTTEETAASEASEAAATAAEVVTDAMDYVTEVRVREKQRSVAFDCSLFRESTVGYCFKYVSSSNSGAVYEQRTVCLPSTVDPGKSLTPVNPLTAEFIYLAPSAECVPDGLLAYGGKTDF